MQTVASSSMQVNSLFYYTKGQLGLPYNWLMRQRITCSTKAALLSFSSKSLYFRCPNHPILLQSPFILLPLPNRFPHLIHRSYSALVNKLVPWCAWLLSGAINSEVTIKIFIFFSPFTYFTLLLTPVPLTPLIHFYKPFRHLSFRSCAHAHWVGSR